MENLKSPRPVVVSKDGHSFREDLRVVWLYALPLAVFVAFFLIDGILCAFGFKPVEELMAGDVKWALSAWKIYMIFALLYIFFSVAAFFGLIRIAHSGMRLRMAGLNWFFKLLLGFCMEFPVLAAVFIVMFICVPKMPGQIW